MKLKLDSEKLRPFECGFTPKAVARQPFSIRFFLVAILFLIFDVELILIFPVLPRVILNPSFFRALIIFFILIILLVGLFYEITQGILT